jgi:hypothetical protein
MPGNPVPVSDKFIREDSSLIWYWCDMDSKWTVSPDNILYKCGWSPCPCTFLPGYQHLSTKPGFTMGPVFESQGRRLILTIHSWKSDIYAILLLTTLANLCLPYFRYKFARAVAYLYSWPSACIHLAAWTDVRTSWNHTFWLKIE